MTDKNIKVTQGDLDLISDIASFSMKSIMKIIDEHTNNHSLRNALLLSVLTKMIGPVLAVHEKHGRSESYLKFISALDLTIKKTKEIIGEKTKS